MRIITRDDIVETYIKIFQRGAGYILSKFNPSQSGRTKSTFDDASIESSNYWIIPRVRERWNMLISGNKSTAYEEYVVNKYLKGKTGLKMLSLGSGICSHETVFATHDCFAEVKCVDFAATVLEKARQNAEAQGIHNMVFEATDVNAMQLPANAYDVVLFHSSLHHFKNIDKLLDTIKNALKKDGLLLINEYVGPARIQLQREQVKEINRVLKNEIPEKYRRRFKTNFIKKRISGPGWLRMIITDPSEAVESDRILPVIHQKFETLEEKNLGNNLLMLLFKDIAHNFLNNDAETNALLDKIFSVEDNYLEKYPSDFVFGIYRK